MLRALVSTRILASGTGVNLLRRSLGRRTLHATRWRNAIQKFEMPAMSPTMNEGGIAQWKVKEGEAFSAGDVLLEVETDKATIDVEAQDDGVLGKILALDGSKNIPVGKVIALLAEEGDDISNLEVPDEASPKNPQKTETESTPQPSKTTESALQAPTPQPVNHEIQIQHSKPLFPSVQRLLVENGVENADKIKGTGIRGMLTKGDVLAFLGRASSPVGTYKPLKVEAPASTKPKEEAKLLAGQAVRQLIVSGLQQSSLRARSIPPSPISYDFDAIINDYLPASTAHKAPVSVPAKQAKATDPYFEGLL